MDYMGTQHNSEPVTDADKKMSKRHKANRKRIGGIKDKIQRLKASIPYNEKHAKEHTEQNKVNRRELKKLGNVFAKAHRK